MIKTEINKDAIKTLKTKTTEDIQFCLDYYYNILDGLSKDIFNNEPSETTEEFIKIHLYLIYLYEEELVVRSRPYIHDKPTTNPNT